MRFNYYSTRLLLGLLLLNVSGLWAQSAERPNIILIIADDMNDYVGFAEGHPQGISPNLDRMARDGVKFENAYCNSPVCAASRASFMSGKDPIYTTQLNNDLPNPNARIFRNLFRAETGNETVYTFPELMKDSAGYYTYGINKIFHGWTKNFYDNDYDTTVTEDCDRGLSWNKSFDFNIDFELSPDGPDIADGVPGLPWGILEDSLESQMIDYKAADSAIAFLEAYSVDKSQFCDRPFFMAVGFRRPHTPLFVPEKYFPDDYTQPSDYSNVPYDRSYNDPTSAWPPNGIVLQGLTDPPFQDIDSLSPLAQGMAAGNNQQESMENYYTLYDPFPVIEPGLDSAGVIEAITRSRMADCAAAYLASISFVDAQIGRIMDELDTHPELKDNTIIMFISDHGYSMGEKGHWGKFTPWETEMRIPMFIVDPKKGGGRVAEKPVSLLDVFPTMLDYAGVEMPRMPDGRPYADGQSLVSLINNPEDNAGRPILLSMQVEREFGESSCFPQYSVRDHSHRFVQLWESGDEFCTPGLDTIIDLVYELGDQRQVDPNEWYNLAGSSDEVDFLVSDLAEYLPDGSYYGSWAANVQIQYDSLACRYLPGESVDLQAFVDGPSGSREYDWISSDGQSSNLENPSFIIPAGQDRLAISLEVEDSVNGWKNSDRFIIEIDNGSLPISTFSVDTLESARSIRINPDFTEQLILSRTWEYGDGSTTTGDQPQDHIYSAPGTYTLRSIIQYGNDPVNPCEIIHSETVTVPASAFDASVCDGPLYGWTSASSSGALELSWQNSYLSDTFIVDIKPTDFEGGGWTRYSSNSTSIIIGGLEQNTSHTWRVRSVCSSGDRSDWSMEMRTPTERCTRPLDLRSTRLDASTVRLAWDTVPEATGGYRSILQLGSSIVGDELTSNSKQVFGMLEPQFYKAQVYGLCANLDGSVSQSPDPARLNFDLRKKGAPIVPGPAVELDAISAIFRSSPNPTRGLFQVEWENALTGNTLRILDVQGRVVAQHIIEVENGSQQFDLSGMSPGIYYVQLGTQHQALFYQD
jgi:arylsulfatase A-like enzyme